MKRIAIPVLTGLLLLGGGAAMAAPRPSPTPTPTPPSATSFELVKKSQAVASNDTVGEVVYCPVGKIATGGGAQPPSQEGTTWALQATYPVTDGQPLPIGWGAQVHRYGPESTVLASITVYAVCATVN